jgi:two-component system CheB/CheR fusion protein
VAETRATVLVVEDDVGLATLQQRRLERAGYAVASAATAAEALEQMRRHNIDLLVLDERLPGATSGLELYQQLKAAGQDVPAILVTGFQSEELVLQALRAGVRDFVPKNDEFLDHLLPAIARVIKQVGTERELAESRARTRAAQERQELLEREIAERKRAEEALKDADRRKDEFLAMLAHELRNPLAPVRSALHILRLDDSDGERRRQTYDLLERQIEHLVRLVDDLLDVSRITRGKINMQKVRVDLASVVARAIEGSRPAIKERGHTLEVALPKEPVAVTADPVRLAQVIWNLLNNAAKYTPEGGRIWLTAAAEGSEAVVRVRDTGVGIPAEMLPKVFDLFTQVDRAIDRSLGGLGIGLTLVRRLTELHGGTVEAFSGGAGQGSEFVVRLPQAPEETPAHPVVGQGEKGVLSGPAPAVRRRLLVVDDNKDSADTLAMLLRLLGNDVDTAHDGVQALQAVADYRPDAVLLDIGLPGMSGYDVAREVRVRPELGQPILIALTGFGSEEDRRQSRESGFNAHLVKPVELTTLQALLAEAVLPT